MLSDEDAYALIDDLTVRINTCSQNLQNAESNLTNILYKLNNQTNLSLVTGSLIKQMIACVPFTANTVVNNVATEIYSDGAIILDGPHLPLYANYGDFYCFGDVEASCIPGNPSYGTRYQYTETLQNITTSLQNYITKAQTFYIPHAVFNDHVRIYSPLISKAWSKNIVNSSTPTDPGTGWALGQCYSLQGATWTRALRCDGNTFKDVNKEYIWNFKPEALQPGYYLIYVDCTVTNTSKYYHQYNLMYDDVNRYNYYGYTYDWPYTAKFDTDNAFGPSAIRTYWETYGGDWVESGQSVVNEQALGSTNTHVYFVTAGTEDWMPFMQHDRYNRRDNAYKTFIEYATIDRAEIKNPSTNLNYYRKYTPQYTQYYNYPTRKSGSSTNVIHYFFPPVMIYVTQTVGHPSLYFHLSQRLPQLYEKLYYDSRSNYIDQSSYDTPAGRNSGVTPLQEDTSSATGYGSVSYSPVATFVKIG